MFGLFKKKDPFDFTNEIVTVADLYAKELCELTKAFLSVAELDTKSIAFRQKAFGWMFFIMFHIENMENSAASLIISSIQKNMSKAKWSASEINNFFDLADRNYRAIVANIGRGNEMLDTVQHLFFERKNDVVYDMDCKIKTVSAIEMSLKAFHEFHEKVSHDFAL